jgi:hypothetical protein
MTSSTTSRASPTAASCSPDGHKTFSTTLTLTNGMRADGHGDTGGGNNGSGTGDTPIYPGLKSDDNRAYDPGLSVEDKFERNATAERGDLDSLSDTERAFIGLDTRNRNFNIS